jgi:hypothetical protein
MIGSDRNTQDQIKVRYQNSKAGLDDSATPSKKKLLQSVGGSSFSKIDIKDSMAKKSRVTSGRERSLRSPKVDSSSSPYKNENIKP